MVLARWSYSNILSAAMYLGKVCVIFIALRYKCLCSKYITGPRSRRNANLCSILRRSNSSRGGHFLMSCLVSLSHSCV